MQRLILHPDESSARESIALPPGAIAAAQRRQREQHAGIGFLVGGVVGEALALSTPQPSCNDFNDLGGCFHRSETRARNLVLGGVAGLVAGTAIGWLWPVSR
jgi:hypothetical protein